MLHEIFPKKLHIEYVERNAEREDYVLNLMRDRVLVHDDADNLSLPTVGELEIDKEKLRFLFRIDDACFYMNEEEKMPEEFGRYTYAVINSLRRHKPQEMSFAVQLSFRLATWYKNSAYCGRCGAKTRHSENERALVCPECKNRIYPMICPSVIVLIKDGERALLTRYQATHNFYRNYALVAGYVETGETPEEAVAREVMEEVGIKVKNITYYNSQPWPLSGALLLGYVCDLDGDDTITRDEGELEEALWINRDELPDRSKDVSLTSDMIEAFRVGRIK